MIPGSFRQQTDQVDQVLRVHRLVPEKLVSANLRRLLNKRSLRFLSGEFAISAGSAKISCVSRLAGDGDDQTGCPLASNYGDGT